MEFVLHLSIGEAIQRETARWIASLSMALTRAEAYVSIFTDVDWTFSQAGH
jgi:hypothetical protein